MDNNSNNSVNDVQANQQADKATTEEKKSKIWIVIIIIAVVLLLVGFCLLGTVIAFFAILLGNKSSDENDEAAPMTIEDLYDDYYYEPEEEGETESDDSDLLNLFDSEPKEAIQFEEGCYEVDLGTVQTLYPYWNEIANYDDSLKGLTAISSDENIVHAWISEDETQKVWFSSQGKPGVATVTVSADNMESAEFVVRVTPGVCGIDSPEPHWNTYNPAPYSTRIRCGHSYWDIFPICWGDYVSGADWYMLSDYSAEIGDDTYYKFYYINENLLGESKYQYRVYGYMPDDIYIYFNGITEDFLEEKKEQIMEEYSHAYSQEEIDEYYQEEMEYDIAQMEEHLRNDDKLVSFDVVDTGFPSPVEYYSEMNSSSTIDCPLYRAKGVYESGSTYYYVYFEYDNPAYDETDYVFVEFDENAWDCMVHKYDNTMGYDEETKYNEIAKEAAEQIFNYYYVIHED